MAVEEQADQKLHKLEISNLRVMRSDVTVFSGVNFSLESGESLQISGSNGSGKTTLLRAICGLCEHDSGEVLYNAKTTNFIDEQAQNPFYQELLYLGHGLGLKPKLTAEQNLNFYRQLRFFAEPKLVLEALKMLRVGAYFDVLVERLSAGQKRRVALSRLITEPASLWVLDEPLVALDKQGQEWLVEQCNQHLARGGLLIITSHQPIAGINGLRELTLA